jgi:hypothetical protein
MQGRCSKPLSIGEREGNMPQDRLIPTVRSRPSVPSARNRPNKLPTGGLIALIALLALILLALLRLFTIPSVSHRDLSRLFRIFRIFLRAPLQASGTSG